MPRPHCGLSMRRIHDAAEATDGHRVLVDRLWPRGIRRDAAGVDAWLPSIAPSTALRRWFGHDKARWNDFVARYRAELDANPDAVGRLATLLRVHGRVTLLFAAHDRVHNHAAALLDYMTSPPPMSPPAPTAALRERLHDEHRRILALVVAARVALVSGDVAAARGALDEVAALHHDHAEHEQTHLFARLPPAARWPARVYAAEHRQLDALLGTLRERLLAAPARLRRPASRLQWLDASLTLHHVFEHHFEREEQGLFNEATGADPALHG